MWKLKIAEGGDDEWLTTTNNHVGRQHWEFDPDAGTEEERTEIEKMRLHFKLNRFQFKQSADLLMRTQVSPIGFLSIAKFFRHIYKRKSTYY